MSSQKHGQLVPPTNGVAYPRGSLRSLLESFAAAYVKRFGGPEIRYQVSCRTLLVHVAGISDSTELHHNNTTEIEHERARVRHPNDSAEIANPPAQLCHPPLEPGLISPIQ